MEYITLKDIAIINMGQSPDSKTYNEEKEGIPFYQGKSDFGKINPIPRVWCSNPIKIAEKEDILISVRAPIGDTNIATEKCCIGRGLAAIRPLNENINQKYLYYLLNSKYKELNKYGTGSTFKAITKDNLYNLKCTQIPDIKEQTKVVKKLDNVSQIIEIKKEQLENLNNIIKSQFVEMFESGKYPKKRMDEVATLKSGTTFNKEYELQNGDLLYCKVSDMNLEGNEKYMFSSKTYVSKEIGLKASIPANSVIFPKRGGAIGTNKKRILLNDTCVDLNTMGVTPKENINIQYLYYYFINIDLATLCDGSAIPQLNNKNIGPLEIAVPPIELQNQFADIVKQIDKQKFEIEKSLKEMEELYDSLMEEYFG